MFYRRYWQELKSYRICKPNNYSKIYDGISLLQVIIDGGSGNDIDHMGYMMDGSSGTD